MFWLGNKKIKFLLHTLTEVLTAYNKLSCWTAVGNTNLIVLVYDNDTDEDQDGDTDSADLMTPSAMHKMPHVEMVAPVETDEEKVHKEEKQEPPSKWLPYMGLVATKPVFGVSDKARLKPVPSATETS